MDLSRTSPTPLLVLVLLGLLGPVSRAGETKSPNVLVIMTDDQGYGEFGCHGNELIQTPHLDALHAQSLRLTNFHVDPTCSPTRAALLTGRYSMRTGVWHTIQGRSMLHPDELTLGEALRDAGWATGLFGKWHLGDAYPCRPEDQGFERVLTHGGGGLGNLPDHWGNDYFDDHYRSGGRFSPGAGSSARGTWTQHSGYCTDVWFEQAMAWIDEHADEPFFCFLPTNAPHHPYIVGEEYQRPYLEAGLGEEQANFYGMITCIDDNMGRLLAFLDERGLREDTILVYTSDNGSSAGWMENPSWPQFNAGMKGFKGSAHEGGHRVPCFVRWPARGIGGEPGSGHDAGFLCAHLDLMPTLLDWCGVAPDRAPRYDGISLAAALDGKADPPSGRKLIVQSQRIERPAKWRTCSVMSDHYRLIGGKSLYDLRTDPGQERDIAAAHPQVVAEHRAAYEVWWAELTAELVDVAYVLGDEQANPTRLTTHDLHHAEPNHDGAPWHQAHASRDARARGYFVVDVAAAGRYRFGLGRFPEEHPGPTGADRAIVRVGEASATADCDPAAPFVSVELDLQAGRGQRLVAEFHRPDRDTPSTALFVEVERLAPRDRAP